MFHLLLPAVVLGLAIGIPHDFAAANALDWVRISKDGRGFSLAGSGQRFVPLGFNYDHDGPGRLIEDYWDNEWKGVEEDFREMKQLGASVVRIHLQFGKFMKSRTEPNAGALRQLGRLVKLAEQTKLYLDLTGLGCYHKKDVPAWYDKLAEADRWAAQARFWEAVAKECANSPAVFCYDLMNEPVVPGGRGKRKDWLGPPFGDKHFVQFIALETKGRKRHDIAKAWVHTLVAAVRRHDKRRLITVGLVPWSLDRPGLTSGFIPKEVAGELDFVAVHIYPERGKRGDALKTLKGFDVGKPVVIEEMFPLKCTAMELEKFIAESKTHAAGWIGFYWGKTPAELRKSGTLGDALMLSWLELFQRLSKSVR
jgi:Cellulase (glycosyl hydrolase family 5)